jgi:hypothetical protein
MAHSTLHDPAVPIRKRIAVVPNFTNLTILTNLTPCKRPLSVMVRVLGVRMGSKLDKLDNLDDLDNLDSTLLVGRWRAVCIRLVKQVMTSRFAPTNQGSTDGIAKGDHLEKRLSLLLKS